MKKIIVLGCSKNQIEYLKVLKQKFQIILLDKNINSPGRKFAYQFFHCAYDDTKKINNLFQKNLIKSKYIFLHHLTLHLLDFHIWQKNWYKKISISKNCFNYIE